MRYLVTFSYDGSKFNGYQKQPNKNTVQDKLEEALAKIENKKVSIVASGRTDRGVHAINQKAHFDLDVDITPEKLKMALNSLIPREIYVKKVSVVDSGFHARFNVISKEYIYKINLGEYNPIEKDYIYQYNMPLDIKSMKKAIKKFIGVHNFKSFTAADDIKDNYERQIFKASIDLKNDILSIKFIGTGFMRYMVRNIVGTLIAVGEHKIEISDIDMIFDSQDRKKACKTAPSEGLYLNNVKY